MVKGHQHGVLHLVVPAAIAAGTLLTWFELHLEFNEVVLLAWTILGPLHALLALILPILGGNPELLLYLFLFFICPTALLYFFGDYVDFNDVSLLMICVAPAISFLRVLHSKEEVSACSLARCNHRHVTLCTSSCHQSSSKAGRMQVRCRQTIHGCRLQHVLLLGGIQCVGTLCGTPFVSRVYDWRSFVIFSHTLSLRAKRTAAEATTCVRFLVLWVS